MYLVYVDESMDQNFCAISALAIPHDRWYEALDHLKAFRKRLRDDYGIFIRKEIHAREFVAGRGRIGTRIVPKGLRAFLFREILRVATELPGAMLFNAVCTKKTQARGFEYLMNRIQRNMEINDDHALIICDEGKEYLYPMLTRRMRVHNPIPSRYGSWETGQATKQIQLTRLIEDPQFVRSEQSYFVQLADCCAYALLRKEKPLASKTAYDLHLAFYVLASILVRQANGYDRYGIIRA